MLNGYSSGRSTVSFNMLRCLKALEDKTYRGAMIASPSNPWGGGQMLTNHDQGYHAVWSRILSGSDGVHSAKRSRQRNRALRYLFQVAETHGVFTNYWVEEPDGGGGLAKVK